MTGRDIYVARASLGRSLAGFGLAVVAAGATDGFNIMPPVLPSGLERFVDEVVPILQERGRFRIEYTGHALREHYGLPRPANRRSGLPGRHDIVGAPHHVHGVGR